MRLAALFVVIAALVGCQTVPVVPEYDPPNVTGCKQGSTQPVPAWPVLFIATGPAYTVQVLYLLAEERALRAKEHDCLQRMKRGGLIE